MGDISDGMCVKCGRDIDDKYGSGICAVCAAVPALSVAKVRAKYLSMGMDVARPEMENAQYDLVYRDSGTKTWRTVQVKTAYGGVVNTCRPDRVGRKPYTHDMVDQIAIVDGDDIFVLLLEDCNNGGRMKMEDIRADYFPLGA